MVWIRKVVFYLFVLIFIVYCPRLILYSLGYFFETGSNPGFVKTGLIYVSSVPPGAEVRINGKPFEKNTPALIRDLIPGNYTVSLSLADYRSWSHHIPVEEGKASALDRVLLLPSNLNRVQLLDLKVNNLIPVSGSEYLILSVDGSAGGLMAFHTKDEEFYPLFSPSFAHKDLRVQKVMTQPGSTHIVVCLREDARLHYYWKDIEEKKGDPAEITDVLPENPESFFWNKHTVDRVFVVHQGALIAIDLKDDKQRESLIESVRGMGLWGNKLYVLEGTSRFARWDENGQKEDILLSDPGFFLDRFGVEGFYHVHFLTKKILLFQSESGRLVTNRLPYDLLDGGVEGLEMYPEGKKVLLWTRHWLGILDYSSEDDEKKIFQRGPELIWIYKNGQGIEQAYWVFDGSHVIFRDENSVYFLELGVYDKPVPELLMTVAGGSAVDYSDETGKLYYLEPGSRRLNTAEILPKRHMLLLPFPEIEEELKESGILGA